VLSVAGIGGYFWWQLQPKGAMIAKPALPPPPATQSPAPAPTMAAVSPAPTPAAASAAMSAASPPAGQSGTAGTIKPPMPAKAAADDLDDDDLATASSRAARSRRTAARIEPEDDSPIRVTREPLRVDPAINRGFEAFNRGELTMAQLEYERARKTDPRNPDILHGLAAIALRQGRYDQAEAYYRQVLESDPQDSVALAALLNQRGQMDPGATESRLKSLAASQPDLAAPHFSLGNLYARQARWADAQQAYFRAYSAEPDNPDILYNLAISLEHLRQNKLAAQYYAQAIAAATNRPAGFDRAQAAARLKSLQP
jgi:tetratricopeptide (TPR) repeat protein